MATLNINGKKVTVDDSFLSLPPDQQEATVNEIAASFAPQEEESPWMNAANTADAFGRGVANGATFGFADYAGAGARWLGGKVLPWQSNVTYDEALREVKGQDAALAEQYPVADLAGNVMGGLGTGVAMANRGLTLAGRLGTGQMAGVSGLAARTGLMGAEGAGIGALTALGNDQDISEGAKYGAIGGAAGNILGEGIQKAANYFRPSVEHAKDYIARAAGMDNITPQSGAARLSELGPEGVVADLGPNLTAQARGAYVRPGEASSVISDALVGRGNRAGERIKGAVDQSLGARSNVLDAADDIIKTQSEAARPLYEVALPTPVPKTDELMDLLNRPSAKSAVEQAKRNVLDRGGVFDINNPTVEVLDEVKKALDDVIEPAKRAGEKSRVSTLTKLKNDIVKFADDVSDEYPLARKAFEGPSQVLNALDDGQKVFSNAMTPDQLTRKLSKLDDASREAYIQGARQQVENVMGTARKDAQSARALFDKGYNREKLSILLGAEEANNIIRAIDAENAFVATRGSVMGGSNTVPSANASELVAGGNTSSGFLRNVGNFNYGDALGQVADSIVGGAISSRNDKINAEIAKMLMSNDPSILAQRNVPTAVRDAVARSLIYGATPQLAGN